MKWPSESSIFFLFINRNEISPLMIKHARPLKRLVDYGTQDNVEFVKQVL